MRKVLFVCVENSCRSQIAEAYGKMLGSGVMQVYSSGSRPSGSVNQRAIAAMADEGYDLSTHFSKSLDEVPDLVYDMTVTMGCGDECPTIKSRGKEDWDIPDPREMNMEEFVEVRNMIKSKVLDLVSRYQSG